jgi:hypothetical protein
MDDLFDEVIGVILAKTCHSKVVANCIGFEAKRGSEYDYYLRYWLKIPFNKDAPKEADFINPYYNLDTVNKIKLHGFMLHTVFGL